MNLGRPMGRFVRWALGRPRFIVRGSARSNARPHYGQAELSTPRSW
jgi:hypothetical protein